MLQPATRAEPVPLSPQDDRVLAKLKTAYDNGDPNAANLAWEYCCAFFPPWLSALFVKQGGPHKQRWLRDYEVERATNGRVRANSLRKDRLTKQMYPYHRLGRLFLYSLEEIDAVIEANRFGGKTPPQPKLNPRAAPVGRRR